MCPRLRAPAPDRRAYLGADLARHAADLRGERAQLVDHRVDGVLELEDLAAHVHGDLLATGRRSRRPSSPQRCCAPGREIVAMEFTLSVRSFHVPATPGPGLAAELAFRADLARDAGHFGRERVELVHHRVDRVLELEDLASDVDGDLRRQVAVGHGGRHVGDVAHLPVRLMAIELTLSVRSFHVPATPGTCA